MKRSKLTKQQIDSVHRVIALTCVLMLGAIALIGLVGMYWTLAVYALIAGGLWWRLMRPQKAMTGPRKVEKKVDRVLLQRKQDQWLRAIEALVQEQQVHVSANHRVGPFTWVCTLRPTMNPVATLKKLEGMKGSLPMMVGAGVRTATGPEGFRIEVELPDDLAWTPSAEKLVRAGVGVQVPVGIDADCQPVTIDLAQHGTVYVQGPQHSGKTVCARAMLWMLKQNYPGLEYIVCGLQAKIVNDWADLGGAGCLGMVYEPDEIEQALQWAANSMNQGRNVPLLVVVDDLLNLLSRVDIAAQLDEILFAGRGLNTYMLITTQGGGSAETLGSKKSRFGQTARIMFKPSDNLSATQMTGRKLEDTGVGQLSGRPGDAIFDDRGRIIRVATPTLKRLPRVEGRAGEGRPWKSSPRTDTPTLAHVGRSEGVSGVVGMGGDTRERGGDGGDKAGVAPGDASPPVPTGFAAALSLCPARYPLPTTLLNDEDTALVQRFAGMGCSQNEIMFLLWGDRDKPVANARSKARRAVVQSLVNGGSNG